MAVPINNMSSLFLFCNYAAELPPDSFSALLEMFPSDPDNITKILRNTFNAGNTVEEPYRVIRKLQLISPDYLSRMPADRNFRRRMRSLWQKTEEYYAEKQSGGKKRWISRLISQIQRIIKS